jgi:MFS family permease
MITQMAVIGRDRGLGLGQAGLLLSAYALSQIVGRLGIGALVDRYPANRMAALFGAVSAAGFAALVPGGGGFALALAAVFAAGVLHGAEFDLLPYFATRLFPLSTYGELYGRLTMLSILGTAAGIAGFGWLRDLTGSYATSLAIGAIAMLLASALLYTLPSTRREARVSPSASG